MRSRRNYDAAPYEGNARGLREPIDRHNIETRAWSASTLQTVLDDQWRPWGRPFTFPMLWE